MVEPVSYFCTSAPVSALCFYQPTSSENRRDLLLAGLSDGTLSCWDLKSCSLVETLKVYESPVLWIGFLMDQFLIVQARFEPQVKVLALKQKTKWEEISSFILPLPHLGFCRGDIFKNFVAFPSSDSEVAIAKWQEEQNRFDNSAKIESDSKDGMITSVRFFESDSIDFIMTTHESRRLIVWSYADEKVEPVSSFLIDIEDFMPLATVFDSQKCVCAVAGSQDKLVSLKFNVADKTFAVLTVRDMPSKGLSSLCLRSDKKILAAGGWDSTLKLFSWLKPEKLKPLGALKFHSESVDSIACTSRALQGVTLKGHLIAAGSKDQKVSLWSVYNNV